MRTNTQKILIEDHEHAYYLWKKNNLMNQTVIHIDAHIDVMPDSAENIHLGNFLFQAIKEKIVNKLYWIVPGTLHSFEKDFLMIKKIISMLSSYDEISSLKRNIIVLDDQLIKTTLFGIPIIICTLDNLPIIKESVLLDIDIDFLVIESIRNNSNLDHIGKRKPWIDTNTFIQTLQSKINNYKCLTIAYSVNGGYTPLIYKTIGDEIAKAFQITDTQLEQRLLAGAHFKKFRLLFDENNLSEAKKYFFNAINLNSLYATPENNYGSLYLKSRDFIKAEAEFSKMLKINPTDINCLISMGILCIYRSKIQKAQAYFTHAFQLDPQNWILPFYLALIAYKQKHFTLSEVLAQTSERLNSQNFYPKYLLAKLLKLKNEIHFSKRKYKEALQTDSLSSIPLGLELLID